MSYKLNYPVETPEAIKFWGSRHKCNRAKSIIAFSLNLRNANDNLKRFGYSLQWRNRAINAFAQYVNYPTMVEIPFTPMSIPWWDCMRYIPPSTGDYIITEYDIFIISEDGENIRIEEGYGS